MKKLVSLAAAVLLVVTLLAGCNGPKTGDVRITAIAGPTGVGLVDLMKKQDEGSAANNYTFKVVTEPTQAAAAISNGSADIAAVPTNMASTLYQATKGQVQVLAVNTLGVLHILSEDTSIQSVADLKGKTIYTSGKGANPEYILKYVLGQNGIDPINDVKIEFVADNDALAVLVGNGTAKVAMVPEPKATACLLGNAKLRRVLNMTKEWEKVAGGDSTLMMGCVVARKEFVKNNPGVVKTFLKEYKASIETVAADALAAAKLCVTYKIIPKEPLAKAAIPNCHLTFVSGAAMKEQLSGYLKVLKKFNVAAIGGQLPEDDFYYVG